MNLKHPLTQMRKPLILALAIATSFQGFGQAAKPTSKAIKKAVADATTKASYTGMVVGQTNTSGTKFIEKVNAEPGKLIIPYEKYQLANGLYVVLHEDKSDPIVHVDVTYHVGSAREEIGKSGFAHFFEHMMFQGSDNVADEEHFKVVSEAGGTLNGTTNRDRTNYFETLPKNQLEVALWLEADRMGFLLDAVTQKKFEIQRATVKNERGQNYDNRPYGLAQEKISTAVYPYGHPYSWLTIGYIEDLNRVEVQDLKNFFLRWYGPNNATLTVGGDFDGKAALGMIEKYFAPIPRGPEVKNMKLPMPVLDKDRYLSMEDKVRFPMLLMQFPSVANYHPDEAPLDVLADILGGGETSLFYKNFVKSQKALGANVFNPCSELAGEFTVQVIAYPNKGLKDILSEVRSTFEEFEKAGVSDDQVNRFITKYEAQLIDGFAEVSGKVSQLAAWQTFTGNPNRIQAEIARYKAVKKEDVIRVYNQYIKGKYAAILSVVPKGQLDKIAAPDNFKVDESGYKKPADEYKGLVYNKAKDNFDRSKKPAAGANPVVNIPKFYKGAMANGLKYIGTQNSEIPKVAMLLSVKGGHRLSAKDPKKAGIANLVADMMNESNKKYTTEQFAAELERLGAEISVSAGPDEMQIEISCLTRNLDKTLELAKERLMNPAFKDEDFARVQSQALEGIANQATQPTAIAGQVYNTILFGKNNIRSVPVSGTEETVGSITLDDVKKWYADNFSPAVANLVIVGDVSEAQILPKLGFLKAWTGKKVEIPAEPKAPKIEKTKIYLVDKDGAPQSEIRIGYVSMPYDPTGEYYKAGIMNFQLGGAFNSRININLREDKGWTYGARSGFQGTKVAGPFTASAGVKGQATDSSVVEFMKEMKKYRESGITAEELAFTKSSIGQSEARKYESAFQKAMFLERILEYNLPESFVAEQNKILSGITKAEIDRLAKAYLPVDNMAIVVVGDAEKIKPGLDKLGYEVIEMDTQGNPLANK